MALFGLQSPVQTISQRNEKFLCRFLNTQLPKHKLLCINNVGLLQGDVSEKHSSVFRAQLCIRQIQ
jgi:hypothetical protein